MAEPKEPTKPDEKKKDEKPVPKDNLVESHHTLTIGGRQLKYTVTTGTMVLKEETADREKESEGEKAAGADLLHRLHQRRREGQIQTPDHVLVQRRTRLLVRVAAHGCAGTAPRRARIRRAICRVRPSSLTDNEYSLLDETDLVFIDPVSTGYSRAVEGQKPVEYHGFKKDIESVGDFIRLYTTRYKRWLSPKFLAGESLRHNACRRAFGLSLRPSRHDAERHHAHLRRAGLCDALTLPLAMTCRTSCICPVMPPPPGITDALESPASRCRNCSRK